jgi:hypothetical protein
MPRRGDATTISQPHPLFGIDGVPAPMGSIAWSLETADHRINNEGSRATRRLLE